MYKKKYYKYKLKTKLEKQKAGMRLANVNNTNGRYLACQNSSVPGEYECSTLCNKPSSFGQNKPLGEDYQPGLNFFKHTRRCCNNRDVTNCYYYRNDKTNNQSIPSTDDYKYPYSQNDGSEQPTNANSSSTITNRFIMPELKIPDMYLNNNYVCSCKTN